MFQNGLKHGKGKWKKSPSYEGEKGNSYEGEYSYDKKNGWGIFEWESGNMYKGHYLEDERNGFGEMYWTDSSIYKGQWMKGIQHGIGLMIFPDGERKAGFFELNVYKQNLNNIEEFDEFINNLNDPKIPAEFREELEDYIREKE